MTSHELAAALEFLAKELRERPDVETGMIYVSDNCVEIRRYTCDKENLKMFAKIGNIRKEYDGDQIKLWFGSGAVRLLMYAERNLTCKIIKPAEYDCEPILSPEEEAEMGVR